MSAPHIFDKISECDKYVDLHPRFAKAFAFLKRPDLRKLALGRYEIIPGECWASIEAPMLHAVEGAKLEMHRKYIDIQAPLMETEIMGVRTAGAAEHALPFDEEKDCVLFTAPFEPVKVRVGEFAIFFPPDGAHAPCCSDDGALPQKKLIIKVLA